MGTCLREGIPSKWYNGADAIPYGAQVVAEHKGRPFVFTRAMNGEVTVL